MQGREILTRFVREHATLRDRLLEWAAALNQVTDGSYGQCQHAVSILGGVCEFLEYEATHHFREEEMALYAAARQKLPRLRTLVAELQDEHDLIRQGLEEFRRRLAHFNTSGDVSDLPRRGQELIGRLRQHMDREEKDLHPVVLRELGDEDWTELGQYRVNSEVA
jgi:hemerythrin-like domain-containing protein